eukprot:gnl/TRDRNA2_/TRDRNA2_117795_c1_seq1.p1 gnl/TRDRNA2_/TRDRNA2_117795_c1~~gnl/TRDRNA2_/TRDRNA2_117795_c1_seq1.p1  ORF type:complete len:100 (+),score=9.59 gnl/TRDRNA2_/TRDRNA2_117795_c1_seq1:78-377(+)
MFGLGPSLRRALAAVAAVTALAICAWRTCCCCPCLAHLQQHQQQQLVQQHTKMSKIATTMYTACVISLSIGFSWMGQQVQWSSSGTHFSDQPCGGNPSI